MFVGWLGRCNTALHCTHLVLTHMLKSEHFSLCFLPCLLLCCRTMFVVSASCSFEMVYVLSTLKSEHSLCAGSGDPCNGNKCWCGLRGSNGDVFPCLERVRTSTVWIEGYTCTMVSAEEHVPSCAAVRSPRAVRIAADCLFVRCWETVNLRVCFLAHVALVKGALSWTFRSRKKWRACRCSHSKFWQDPCS